MATNYKVFAENNEVVFKLTTGAELEFRHPTNSHLTASVVNTTKIKIAKTDGTNLFYDEPYASFKDASGTALGASAAATVTALNAVFAVPPAENFIVKDPNSDNSGTTKIRHKEGTGGADRDEGGTLELDTHAASIGLYGSYIKITEEDLNNTSGKDGAYGRLQLFLENAGTPVDVLDMEMSSLVQAPAVDLNTSSLDVSGDVTFSSAAGTVTFSGDTSGIDYNDLDNRPTIPSGGVSTTIHYARMSMSSAVLKDGASQQDFTGTSDVDVQFNVQDTVTGSEISTDTSSYDMTVESAGYYRLTVNMSFYSASARATPGIRFNVNGTIIPGESMGYIRAASGQNENTTNLTRVIYLNADDSVNVCAHDESTATGSIYAEEAIFEMEKLEVSVDTDFDNITNTPTTLAGYGITDSLQLGTTAGTALEGDTAIPTSTSDLTNDSGFITGANELDGQILEVFTRSTAYGNGSYEGHVVKFGSDTLQTGKFYVHTSSGWTAVDADVEAKTRGLFGIALGTASGTNGLLVRGIHSSNAHSGYSAGDTLYVSTAEGTITNTAPSATGDFVRVVGYALGSSYIYLDPSPDYIELS